MPLPILGWIVAALGTVAVGYAGKKIFEDDTSSSRSSSYSSEEEVKKYRNSLIREETIIVTGKQIGRAHV